MRSRNTLPRALLMSSRPTTFPSSDGGRGDGATVVVAASSPVGSSSTDFIGSLRAHSCADPDGDGLAPERAARPAADDGREQSRTAAGVHDQEAAVTEFRQRGARERLGETLGDAAGSVNDLRSGDLQQRPELLVQTGL